MDEAKISKAMRTFGKGLVRAAAGPKDTQFTLDLGPMTLEERAELMRRIALTVPRKSSLD